MYSWNIHGHIWKVGKFNKCGNKFTKWYNMVCINVKRNKLKDKDTIDE